MFLLTGQRRPYKEVWKCFFLFNFLEVWEELVLTFCFLLFFLQVGGIHHWSHLSYTYFILLGSFFCSMDSISLLVNGLFRFPISTWFSLDCMLYMIQLYLSRNLSILSRLSNLLTYNLFIVLSYDHLYFCCVSCHVSSFIYDFIYLSSFFFVKSS